MFRNIAFAYVFVFLWSSLVLGGDRVEIADGDWPWWRGPNRDGIAATEPAVPLKWSAEKNVLWKVPVTGRGHGSPTVVGGRIYLATADEEAQVQAVVCYDRVTGKQIWETQIHQGGLEAGKEPNSKSSWASSTVACDGERLFINFLNAHAVTTTALDLQGQQLWQQKVTDYVLHQGYGSSPAVFGPLVIVTADNKSGGAITAFDRKTGDVAWKHQRPELPNYPSPIVLQAAGKDQVVVVGCDLVSSFAPLTGEKLWEVEGATTECVTSTVTDGKLVITSGGYPENHISAIRADGSGETVWRNNTRVYVPSMLVKDGYLYAVADAGIAICYEMATGKEVWKQRLGATFTSSPVLVGDNIFVTSDEGQTVVYRASPEGYALVAENQLAEHVVATPTYCGGKIFMRAAEFEGDRRQEYLYCLGEKN